ncbi:MAG: PspA/IM30 family protein, partial [Myxococcales bacterium]|nr:PspA/IM30 family protein [Myxococcales bacterium]
MGIFNRLATLIKSNLNDMISKAEDPEKMLNQVITEMVEQLANAKKQVAVSIADSHRLGKTVEAEQQQAKEWERKAMMAIRAGNDELAKEALSRKREHDNLATTLGEQWEKQKAAVEQLKTALRVLNSKIEEAKRKKNVLIARKKRAEAQKAIHETMQGLSNDSAFDTFNRMEEKIVQMEAEADAQTEVAEQYSGDALSQRFKDLETSR